MFPASLYSRAAVAYLQTARRTLVMAASRLPDELEGEVDLAGSRLRRGNETSAGNSEPALIENGQILSGRGKIGAIKDIEKFGAELSIEALRNSFHGVVLENREIQVRYAWTNQAVAAQISPAVETRKGEALSLDIGIGISGIDQRRAPRPSDESGRLAGLVQFLSCRIAAQDGSKRLSCTRFVDTPELPAAQGPF